MRAVVPAQPGPEPVDPENPDGSKSATPAPAAAPTADPGVAVEALVGSQSGVLRSVVVLHLVELLWSVALAVPALGVVYLLHAALDEALDRVTAAGGDVRYLDSAIIDFDPTARVLALSTWLGSLSLVVLGMFLSNYAAAFNILAGDGRDQAELRAYIPQFAALWVAFVVGSFIVVIGFLTEGRLLWLMTMVLLVMLVIIWRLGTVLQRVTRRPRFRRFVILRAIWSWLAGGVDMVLVSRTFDSALEDSERLLLMAVVVPVVFEMRFVYVRKLAYAYPGLVVQWPVGVAWASGALHNVVMRMLVLGFDKPTLAMAALAVIDAALRRTTALRDRLFCSKAEREVPHAEHVRSLLRTVDEVVDSYAVLVTLMIALIFRLTNTRHAEEAMPQVQLTLVQLGLETAIDFAMALLVVRLGVSSSTTRRIVDRARRTLSWPRHYAWYALFWVSSSAAYMVSLLMTVSYDPSFCAWSRGDHGWTRVPCRSAQQWLSG